MSDPITAIPPGTAAGDLIKAINDRLRIINSALGSLDATPAGSGSVFYGTHGKRLATPLTGFADAALFFETDRNNVGYQLQARVWRYDSGTMVGLLAARPADLGTGDAGFRFQATDANEYSWTGSAWIAQAQIGLGGAGPPLYKLDVRVGANLPAVHLCDTDNDKGTYIFSSGNNTYFMNGATFDGTNFIAKDTNAGIVVTGNVFRIYINTGLTPGSSFTPTERMHTDASGNLVVTGNVSGGGTDMAALLASIATLTSGKAAHGTYAVAGGNVTI